jgi:K+-transporting ATPase ATPase C chain
MQANGSLIETTASGRLGLIGQPSATRNTSGAAPRPPARCPTTPPPPAVANQGPLNPALEDAVKARIAALQAADPSQTAPIPVDLVTASASGLDPHISPAAAARQAPRIARAARSH